MDIRLEYGNESITLNENQISVLGIKFDNKQSQKLNDYFKWNIFTERKITDFKDEYFYVKDYQRGYRWTESEITALLDDIDAIDNEKYCMQPLVVRKIKGNNFEYQRYFDGELNDKEDAFESEFCEVIDGQQRLTTIRLILAICTDKDYYSIYYEQFRKIDEEYLHKAKEAVENWFQNNENKKQEIKNKIEENLFFIWYELNDREKSSEEIFNNVNAGKVELTNAELFRALLLKTTNEGDGVYNKIEQISFEWDEIEQNLQNNEFWYFIAGETNRETTRIDYILELYAKAETSNKIEEIKDERYSFNVLKSQLESKEDNPTEVLKVWEEIVNVYECLYSWYLDNSLYHLIGFLVCCEEDKKRNKKELTSEIIYEIYKNNKNKNKSELKNYLWKKVKAELILSEEKKDDKQAKKSLQNYIKNIEDVEYDSYTRRVLRACLLFFNIWTCMQNEIQGRFSFFSYKTEKWDIEHINPKQLKEDLPSDIEDDVENYLKNYYEQLQRSADSDDKVLGQRLKETCDSSKNISEKWKACAKIINDEADNNISNLTLLNAKINRSYGNAFFGEKRKEIIENDKKGVFIPICTKNVFLKYYSNDDVTAFAWTDCNKSDYMEKLKECIKDLSIYAEDEYNEQ